MNERYTVSLAILAAMVLVEPARSEGPTSGGGPPEYEVTAIIAGFECGDHLAAVSPNALNEVGDVAGMVTCFLVQRAFRWTAETGLELVPTPAGTSQSQALAIHGSKVVGTYSNADLELGVTGYLYDFQTDQFTSLGTLPGGDWSQARAINSAGEIVGFWGNTVMGPSPLAFIWRDGEMIDIHPDFGTPKSDANDMNNDSIVTGWMGSSTLTDARAFVWENGKVTELPPIRGGFTSEGRAINAMRQVVGHGKMEGDRATLTRAFLWEDNRFTDLGTLRGFDRCAAIDINDSTIIIGGCDQSDNPQNDQLFVWSHGVMVNLNDLVLDNSGVEISTISAINNCGKIAATAHSDDLDATVGVLLSPLNQGILGDLNGDGVVSAGDVLILLSNWGPCDNCEDCSADLNGDCVVGAVDLLILLANWG